MATGCALVASDTAPVREAISHGEQGLLVDFFDTNGLATAVQSLLADDTRRASLSAAARRRAAGDYDLAQLLPRRRKLLGLPARMPQPEPAETIDISNFKSLSKEKDTIQRI
jgi:glycosyltransferase involved in cell wall biosynthesis